MKTKPECLSCFIRQMDRVADRFGASDKIKKEAAGRINKFLEIADLDLPPPYLSEGIYRIITDSVGKTDPYRSIKKSQNDKVLSMEKRITGAIKRSNDPVMTAVKYSIAANTIDFGAQEINDDVEKAIKLIADTQLPQPAVERFFNDLRSADKAAFVLDNAGEIVFDKILIETIKESFDIEFTAVVRGGPIINDVTIDDAKYVGIDQYAEIVEASYAAPGALARKDERLKNLFDDSDLIISKGQGNFESLSESRWRVYFLFLAKCDVVAELTGTALFAPLFLINK